MSPVRKFPKYYRKDQKAMFKLWMTRPTKPITKYAGTAEAYRLRLTASPFGKLPFTG